MSAIVKTTGKLIELQERRLEKLAEAINREHEALERDQKSMLARAFAIGDMLIEAKAIGKETGEIPHGEFGDWCERNVRVKRAQYQRYMRVAREIPKSLRSSLLEAGDGVDRVYATLAGPGDEPDEQKPYWTLEDWNSLPERHRHRIIEKALTQESEASHFNRQDANSEESMGNIEWAKWSWNPVTGCKHDCPYCYARDIAERFYEQKFAPSFWPDRLAAPKNTSAPPASPDGASRNVFSNSMSDLYGRWVPTLWIDAVLKVMRRSTDWNFLMLTKFPKRAAEFKYADNCWIGTSIDFQVRVKAAEEAFQRIDCGVKWLSLEPLLEPLKFTRPQLFNWVVIGGASPSSKTPGFTPPFDWVVRTASQFLEHGAHIYLKTNGRPREYPGVLTPARADDVFHYLRG
jgi:protein gp37